MHPLDVSLPRPNALKNPNDRRNPKFLLEKITNHPFGADGSVTPGTKVVVTKQGLDKWFAQMYGITKSEEYPMIKSQLPT